MINLYGQIEHRATAMPWMTAVRLNGNAVTYGDLHVRVGEYRRVVEAHGLFGSSALAAALTSLLPETIAEDTPLEQAHWIGEAMNWLGRDTNGAGDSLSVAV